MFIFVLIVLIRLQQGDAVIISGRFRKLWWAALLPFLCFLAVLLAGAMLKFSADSAAWVQAVGSVAAIYGAVWIAQRGEREKRREQIAAAEITAAVVRLQLHEIVGALRKTSASADQFIRDERRSALTKSEFLSLRDEHYIPNMAVAAAPTEDQLLRLVPIRGDVSQDILRCMESVRACKRYLDSCCRGAPPPGSMGYVNSLFAGDCRFLELAIGKLEAFVEERYKSRQPVPPNSAVLSKPDSS